MEVHPELNFEAGQEMGKFNIGSTIVLFLEAKGDVKWLCSEGEKVLYGAPLCQLGTGK